MVAVVAAVTVMVLVHQSVLIEVLYAAQQALAEVCLAQQDVKDVVHLDTTHLHVREETLPHTTIQ